ncbi:aminotransferase class I/II-fold pyridoxal phosphate-dependent enzyme [Marinactinospora rubrisoli]|uniref:Aminotransferase class I/II-fold pyridoxal phosphate-dependent enzyme n=1 Tax=Marinactinospora rubrisoli TaxID=2715399 RepID=A0ABW2KFJ9_9ACTN
MEQSRAPVLEAISAFHRRGDVSFNPPGHKQGRGIDPRVREVLGDAVFTSDILSMNALDDRLMRGRVVEQAQELMAEAVGADHTFFSTCGSSLSVKSALLAVAPPESRLLVSRNAHKSVVAAVVLGGVWPVWVHPHFDGDLHLSHPPEPEDVRQALTEHPDARAMLLISPTDYGTCADIAGVSEVCHEHGVPLVVDEAWGAHFPFHDGLPQWGVSVGADVVLTSVHKMGSGLEQSSVFHLRGDRVRPSTLRACEDLLGTTSASVLMFAALDGWRRQMVQQGRPLLDAAIRRAERVREELDAVPGLSILGREIVRPGCAADQDVLKIVVDVRELGVSGYQVADWLHEHAHLNVGLADHRRVAVQITHADDDDTVGYLVQSFRRVVTASTDMERMPEVRPPRPGALELETVMLPRDAFFGASETVPLEKAGGRVAAELVSPYPPGVPVLAPGERITSEVLDYLASGPPAGMLIPDAADGSMRTLRVVAE